MATLNKTLHIPDDAAVVEVGQGDTRAQLILNGDYENLQGYVEGTVDGVRWHGLATVDTLSNICEYGLLGPADKATVVLAMDCAFLTQLRFRVTAITTGSVDVRWDSGSFPGTVLPPVPAVERKTVAVKPKPKVAPAPMHSVFPEQPAIPSHPAVPAHPVPHLELMEPHEVPEKHEKADPVKTHGRKPKE